MKNELIKLIQARPHMSFVEINRYFPNLSGDIIWLFNANIVLWHECSDIGIDIITDLVNSNTIKALPDSEFAYLMDGKTAPFKVLKDIDYNGKEYRWLPITFCMHSYSDRHGIYFK